MPEANVLIACLNGRMLRIPLGDRFTGHLAINVHCGRLTTKSHKIHETKSIEVADITVVVGGETAGVEVSER